MPGLLLAHGLVIDSGVPLPDCRPSTAISADVTYRFGAEREVPHSPGPGRILARMPRSHGDGVFFTLSEEAGAGWLFRFHGVCDVAISPDADAAVFHMDPGADPRFASVLGSGLIIATILTLRGHLVLHASAVEHEGAAVAIVGRSGMGKSTLSTLLCRNGARLMTDDVLRVDTSPEGAWCRLGSVETRLRPTAASLVTDGDRVRDTADGRSALTLPLASRDPLPLRCVVIPSPDREAERVTASSAGAVEALMLLSSFPRIVGWEDPRTRGEQFSLTGDLVSLVPVLVVALPWGPPFKQSLADDLLAVLPNP